MPPVENPRSRRALTFGILATYVLLAAALTYPLVPKMATGIVNDPGDPALNTWILWWNAVTVPYTDAWWNAPAYFPADGVLTFSEHLMGLTPISTPIYWLTGNIQLGYNLIVFLSFPLSAFFGYLLCRDLTGRHDAGFIGGLIFGFTPYRLVQLPHIQALCSYWMPVALFGLHRYLQERRARWLVVFGIGWLMQALSNGYYMAFLSVLLIFWILWFVRRWRDLIAIGIAWGLAALPVVPIILKYREVHHFLGLRRSIDEILLYGADITSLMDHSGLLAFWKFLPAFHRSEGELFPGFAGIVLIAVGLWISRPRSSGGSSPPASKRRRVIRIGLMTVVVILVAGAVTAAISPWEFTLGPLRLSGTHPEKPLTLAFLCGIALLFTTSRVRESLRGRTVLGFYVLAAPLMWLFSFGPKPTFMGQLALYRGPYYWLTLLPGFDTLRVPARFHMVAMVCVSCAAAIGVARILVKLPRRWSGVFTAIVTVVVMMETWTWIFPMPPAPKPWPLQQQFAPGPLVQVPLGGVANDAEVMYRAMWNRETSVVNGYSGYAPPWYAALERGLAAQDPAVLQELTIRGVRQLVLNTTEEGAADWINYLATRPDIQLVADDGQHRLYRLPDVVPPAVRRFGPPVRVAEVTANVGQEMLPRLADGDLKTRWNTGPQKGTEVLQIDLGRPTAIAAVVFKLGPFTMDAPRHLTIECSDDGQAWTEVWRGPGTGPALRGGFDAPIEMPATFDVGDRTTRFLRMRQTGVDEVFYWSIAELSVLAPGRP